MMVNDGAWHLFSLHDQMAACELPERRPRADSPRLYMDGYVPGDRSADITGTS